MLQCTLLLKWNHKEIFAKPNYHFSLHLTVQFTEDTWLTQANVLTVTCTSLPSHWGAGDEGCNNRCPIPHLQAPGYNRSHASLTWSFGSKPVWSTPWKEGDSDFELLLLVLSCHADRGCPGLSWVPMDLQAAKHYDQRWLTVTLTYIKWFWQFSDLKYCCNCCVSQPRSWH